MSTIPNDKITKLIPFDADRAIREKLKCRLRDGSHAYILHRVTKPLTSSGELIGIKVYKSIGQQYQTARQWHLDGKWNDLEAQQDRENDIIGMYPVKRKSQTEIMIERYKKVGNGGWIKVQDTPLPINKYILVHTKQNGIKCVMRVSKYVCFVQDNLFLTIDVNDITHWQDLPTPPTAL